MSKVNYSNVIFSLIWKAYFIGKINHSFSVGTGNLKTKTQMPISRADNEVTEKQISQAIVRWMTTYFNPLNPG